MFLGYESVLEDMEKQPKRAAGTLRVRAAGDTFANVPYANTYTEPISETTALGTGGTPTATTTATLWQLGESAAPSTDDLFLDAAGIIWLIVGVRTRLNGDSGYAAHDLTLMRSP